MDKPVAILDQLINAYYNGHRAFMDKYYLERKIQVTNFTEQDNIVIPSLVYNEVITSFMLIMKLPEDQRSETINSLHKNKIFYMNSKNYIVFKRVM